MNVCTYRRYALDNIVWRPRRSAWEKQTRRGDRRVLRGIVDRGEGYWTNDSTVVIGYVLKENLDCFQAIFSGKRHNRMQEVLNMIKDRVGNHQSRFLSALRRNLLARQLLGVRLSPHTKRGPTRQLPAGMIRLISRFAY